MTVQIDAARLWEHLRVLAEDIGPRLSGTPGDERAVEYIANHFRKQGATVEVQDYACPGWIGESIERTLLNDTGPVPIPAVAQTFTESCDVEAPLICIGTRAELEFAPDLEGKILVIYGEALHRINVDRNPTLLSAEERQPAALVLVSPQEEVSTKLLRDPFIRVPGAAVSVSAGAFLRAREGQTLRLRVKARRYPAVSHNVVGRFPGAGPGSIAVAAHYDTSADIPGATDNASGTAVVLELCEAFAATVPRKYGLDFIAYGAEEYGRHAGNLGAVEYVRRHPAEIMQTVALVEVDCVGTVATPLKVEILSWLPPLLTEEKARVLKVLERFPTYVVDDRSENPLATTAFTLPGVPSLAFNDDYPRLPIHKATDTMALMIPEDFALAARAAAETVWELTS